MCCASVVQIQNRSALFPATGLGDHASRGAANLWRRRPSPYSPGVGAGTEILADHSHRPPSRSDAVGVPPALWTECRNQATVMTAHHEVDSGLRALGAADTLRERLCGPPRRGRSKRWLRIDACVYPLQPGSFHRPPTTGPRDRFCAKGASDLDVPRNH